FGVSVVVLFVGARLFHLLGLSGEPFEWALYMALGIALPTLCAMLLWRREGEPTRTQSWLRFGLASLFLIAIGLRLADALLIAPALVAIAHGALAYRTLPRRERVWACLLLVATWLISSKLVWWNTLDRLLEESPAAILVGIAFLPLAVYRAR